LLFGGLIITRKRRRSKRKKGTEGASEEKRILPEWTLQIDLYLKSSDFSQMEFTTVQEDKRT
jgi:hypothetical protein